MQFSAQSPLGRRYIAGCVIGLQSLVACAAQEDRFSLSVISQAQSVPVGQALIVPPPGGPAVVGVTETAYENGLAQNVLLATNSAVPGCEPCAFTTTGQPAASADAVSPPAVENASDNPSGANVA